MNRYFIALFLLCGCQKVEDSPRHPPVINDQRLGEGQTEWAISCEGGTVSATYNTFRRYPVVDLGNPVTDIFVFNEEKKLIRHFLAPRLEFEDMCQGKEGCNIDFSAGLVQLNSESSGSMHVRSNLALDRVKRTLTRSLILESASGDFVANLWQLTCKPTAIPRVPLK